jgi:hypothetical protein
VDNVAKRREPLPSLSGVYFITPSNESVRQVIEDFKEKPLYKTAHIFFSSAADPRQLNAIKNSPNLMAHLKTLKEVWKPVCLSHTQARRNPQSPGQGIPFLFFFFFFLFKWN